MSLRSELALTDTRLGELLARLQDEDRPKLWREIGRLIDQRRKLAQVEVQRLTAAHQVLTVKEAMRFAAAVTRAVEGHVTDHRVRVAIAWDLAVLLGLDARDAAPILAEEAGEG